LADYDFLSFLGSPLSLALCGAVLLVAFFALWTLLRQWNRHRVADATRNREAATLVFATLTALLLIAGVHAHLDKQDRNIRMLAELEQKNALGAELRNRITAEVDRVRTLLADRTVRRIEQQQLTQAREELARFQSLHDPRITQMLALIDTELQIRALVAQALSETEPAKLFSIYTRLSELVPDHAQYRENAERYATEMKSGVGTATPKTN
jgi:mannosyltransferase OCH1-like enzyme